MNRQWQWQYVDCTELYKLYKRIRIRYLQQIAPIAWAEGGRLEVINEYEKELDDYKLLLLDSVSTKKQEQLRSHS